MKIQSVHDASCVELSRCRGQFSAPGGRDTALDIHAVSPAGFEARLSEVWFERDSTIAPFLEDLGAFERGERHSVTLTDFPFPGREPNAEYSEFRLNLLRLTADLFVVIDLAAAPIGFFRPELGHYRLRLYFQCKASPERLTDEFEKLFTLSQ